eukprot:SAG31_NODE_41652_length_275_cov_0.585227_1_plen_24_part_10
MNGLAGRAAGRGSELLNLLLTRIL